jgi:hypothetical protein
MVSNEALMHLLNAFKKPNKKIMKPGKEKKLEMKKQIKSVPRKYGKPFAGKT